LAQARVVELKTKQAAVTTQALRPGPAVGAFNPSRAAVPLTDVEERALKPGHAFRECEGCPEMVVVPAGSFIMGSSPSEIAALKREMRDDWYDNESPQHRVTIERSFAVGKFEVTFAQWEACVAERACTHTPMDESWGRGRRPVIWVSWNHITQQYLPWLSRKTGKTYRLLTEAEWEYAARAGTTMRYAYGDRLSKSLAQYSEGSSLWEARAGKTEEVGIFPPNVFGLYDMHGNVKEWVQDCWHATYGGAPSNGSAWATEDCGDRVLRGGSWADPSQLLRSAGRSRFPVNIGLGRHGFRVARTF
jgi:formylglycine-generating enzyme required for sulfatase activity